MSSEQFGLIILQSLADVITGSESKDKASKDGKPEKICLATLPKAELKKCEVQKIMDEADPNGMNPEIAVITMGPFVWL